MPVSADRDNRLSEALNFKHMERKLVRRTTGERYMRLSTLILGWLSLVAFVLAIR